MSFAFFYGFSGTLMLSLFSKIQSLVFATRHRNTRFSASQLPYNWLSCVEIVTDASWNIHRHVVTTIR